MKSIFRKLSIGKSAFATLIFSSVFFLFGACNDDELMEEQQLEENILSYVYSIAGTNQTIYYNNRSEITAPSDGEPFYGQDAIYPGNVISYTDNNDGTVTDNVTGLMWSKTTDLNGDGTIDYDDKLTYDEAVSYAKTFDLAGYSDWRLPTIKELYSLIIFSGRDINPQAKTANSPFIDTEYFGFGYGDTDAGECIIDVNFMGL